LPLVQAREDRFPNSAPFPDEIVPPASTSYPWNRDFRLAALAIILVAAASVLGQLATYPNLAWYANLAKPSFDPRDWVFAPVWTTLYLLMAFALWRVLRPRDNFTLRRLASNLLFVQLALNAAWSWMFFATHDPLLGVIDIVPQFLVILGTIVAFRRLDRTAAWCLVPLAAWVAFAGVLNIAVWLLNG
jgi:translocator protein